MVGVSTLLKTVNCRYYSFIVIQKLPDSSYWIHLEVQIQYNILIKQFNIENRSPLPCFPFEREAETPKSITELCWESPLLQVVEAMKEKGIRRN